MQITLILLKKMYLQTLGSTLGDIGCTPKIQETTKGNTLLYELKLSIGSM